MVTGERRRRDARVDGLRWALIAAVSGIHFGVVGCSGKSSKDSSGGSGDGGTSGTSAAQGGSAASKAGGGSGGATAGRGASGNAGTSERGGTSGSAGGSGVGGAGSGGQSGSTSKGGSAGTSDPGGAGNEGGGPNPFPCSSPDAWGSTLQTCGTSAVHRPAAVACPLPDHDSSVSGGEGGATGAPGTLPCAEDADCASGDYCVLGQTGGFCIHPCTDDASCPTSNVCVCDAYTSAVGSMPIEAGRCVSAECTTDADCAPGFACGAPLDPGIGCPQSPTHFACQTPSDQCAGKEDCGSNEICSMTSPRTCIPGAACGRPFLVAGRARSAPSVPSAAWLDAELGRTPLGGVEREGANVSVDALDAAARGVIAEHWLEAGAMEHASVAAFARFALELMTLGAPAWLVEATTRAMADETRHARLCYGLAARYSGDARGPGPLDVTGALADSGLLSVVERAVLEGCIGETQAAVEAAWAAESATDPVVRDVLERIAEDETRHAALAFDFVAWASERDATVRALVERTFARARAQSEDAALGARTDTDCVAAAPSHVSHAALAAHGVLDQATRSEARRAALCEVLPSVWNAALRRSDAVLQELGPQARSAHAGA